MYDNKTKIEVIIGGGISQNNILNDGSGIYISKPVIYENKKVKQLYPNEARLKNLSYGVHIFVDVFIKFNNSPPYMYYNGNWILYDSTKKPTQFNIGFIPVMLGSKVCVLNEMPNSALYNMGECQYDQEVTLLLMAKKKF